MDVLAKRATELFDSSSICQRTPNNIDLILRLTIIQDNKCTRYRTSSANIEPLLEGVGSSPTVQFIGIPVDEKDGRLPIYSTVLKRLITKQLKIDPCVLTFITKWHNGFHRIDNAISSSYIMGTSMYILIWSFNHKLCSTAGLLLDRLGFGYEDIVSDYLDQFHAYHRSPRYLAFVACYATWDVLDRNTYEFDLSNIEHIETVTAFASDGNNSVLLHRHKTETIMSWVKMVAHIHINLASKLRVVNMMYAVMKGVLDNHDPSQTSESCYDNSTEGGDNLNTAVHLLAGHIKAYEGYINYLKERADTLSTVVGFLFFRRNKIRANRTPLQVFALLTHEDSAVSTDIAKASQALAEYSALLTEQAKRDSSGMKSITIITMAFLPATFFATLFAVPTLDWKGSPIVTSDFWIYWAFTLPTTAFVFLLWLSLTYRTHLVAFVARLFRDK
ncbi:hypothetical protein NUW58_g8991 [Xylaria curta]|uniref:Uncharacterized protein n=1 Tax=Xylaria curta TaxID=42375 RepID=A0ACC1N1T1_9PEZI|nr:hypothetical protein NUW58_g8991 [Xylaria curta]